jgi:hypothetical protein
MRFSTRMCRYPSLECLALGEGGLVSIVRRARVGQTEEGLVCTYIFERTLAAW